jgi:oxygen-dependent protoporphyrinogen oxidase
MATTAASPPDHDKDENENEEDDGDESVDSFLSRRFGDAFARTLGSALVHGIYAADSRRLSVRAAFPSLCESEARGNGSVIWGTLGPRAWFGEAARQKRQKAQAQEEEEAWDVDREWEARVRAAALLSFREGTQTLVGALEGCPNVTLRKCTAARRIDQDDQDGGGGSFGVRVRERSPFYFVRVADHAGHILDPSRHSGQ